MDAHGFYLQSGPLLDAGLTFDGEVQASTFASGSAEFDLDATVAVSSPFDGGRVRLDDLGEAFSTGLSRSRASST